MQPEVRFFLDEHFILNLLKDRDTAIQVFKKLSAIHKISNIYEMSTLMFDESFRASIKGKAIRGEAVLGIAHPIDYPNFVKDEKEFCSKVIKCAVDLASKAPYKVFILTSVEQAKKYLENEHYKSDQIRSAIKIVYGDEAEHYIDVTHSELQC